MLNDDATLERIIGNFNVVECGCRRITKVEVE